MVRGRRNDGQPKRPKTQTPVKGPVSAVCEDCGVNAPAKSDGKPMLHYDGRVPNAHVTHTYCQGPNG